jgi:hypothetical protein
VIIIFNSELEGQPALAHQVSNLSQEATRIGNACAYIPKTGKADDLVTLLQKHNIHFGLHQSNRQEKKEIHEN